MMFAVMTMVGSVGAFAPARLLAPAGHRSIVMQMDPPKIPDLGLKGKLEDIGLPKKLAELPEPVQPWVKVYSGQGELFIGDALGLLLASGCNPFAAFPFFLAYFAAAQPLGAYSDDATADYRALLHNLGPALAAGTAGGVLLSAPFGSGFTPFLLLDLIGKFIVTAICLGLPRGYRTWVSTGKLPEAQSFDIDALLTPKD